MNEHLCSNQEIRDYGGEPIALNIEKITEKNQTIRTALWTGKQLQVTVMSIPASGETGLEIHPHTDQFIRVENGCGLAVMGKCKDALNIRYKISSGYAVIIPAGTWHNIINTGNAPLKVYSIYAPAQHPFGTVQETKNSAEH